MLLKRKKVKNNMPDAEINIVSLMDILTTMLFFLILFVSFSNYSVLRSTSLVSSSSSEQPKPVFTLKVTLKSEKDFEIWLGPTRGLAMVDSAPLIKNFKGSRGSLETGFTKSSVAPDLKSLLKLVQANLIEIKKAFPHETKVVLAVSDNVSYQAVIEAMTGLRSLGATEEGFTLKNLVGQTEKTKVLFPEVIISEAKPL